MSARDKRRAPRERHDSVIEIFDKDGKLIAWAGKLVNCSATGACFSAVRHLTVGDQVNARLRLLDKGALDISAHVVWRLKKAVTHLYGIKFDYVQNVYPTGELKEPEYTPYNGHSPAIRPRRGKS
jgi:hypothetical protein